MSPLLTDPWFYAAGLPAVILVGLSKGGFGGAMALLGVPLLTLVVPPVQAAAILLPILILMDMVSLWSWRGNRETKVLRIMLPGAMAGIGVGWLTATIITEGAVRLIVGVVALVFFLRWATQTITGVDKIAGHNRVAGLFWGAISGFTSFVAHAGGPPFQVYVLPFRFDPKTYAGTSVIYFAILNAVKLIPYFALGQLDVTNLEVSAVLMPVAPLATLTGAFLVRRMQPRIFYPFMYAMVLIVALKLIYDGLTGGG